MIFELGFSARNAADHEALLNGLDAFESAPVTDGDHRRRSTSRAGWPSGGSTGRCRWWTPWWPPLRESRDLTVLHYDADFEAIAGVTGQAHRWVVERGSAD